MARHACTYFVKAERMPSATWIILRQFSHAHADLRFGVLSCTVFCGWNVIGESVLYVNAVVYVCILSQQTRQILASDIVYTAMKILHVYKADHIYRPLPRYGFTVLLLVQLQYGSWRDVWHGCYRY